MSYPKFILTNTDRLRLGRVNLHKELLQPGEYCLGGGFYEFDYVSGILLLSGKSYDFGRPKWHCCDELHVPSVYEGLRIMYSSDGDREGAVDLSDELKIVYDD